MRHTLLAFLLAAAFAAVAAAQHPQAVTDCGNCHLEPYSHTTELHWIHHYNCNWCHPDYEFTRSILGPVGTWNHECSACHNPSVIETGNLPTPTKGHRCAVCHQQQQATANPASFHHSHAERADCAVCHGFVPDVGTSIGSGNRDICAVCHTGSTAGVSIHSLHRHMTEERLNCTECHGGVRPPVDVQTGPPVGSATVVCDICHTGQSPAVFATRGAELHRRHIDKHLECGSCHADANLHDDNVPAQPVDDARRQRLDRSGSNECAHCHTSVSASTARVHREHVSGQEQWCFNCHEGNDGRPLGQAGPVATPAQSCQLCHSSRTYRDDFPFAVHYQHPAQKCSSCHQGEAPLLDWPERWLRQPGTFTTYGNGCLGSNQQPVQISNVGLPRIAQPFGVTVAQAPANALAVLLLGFEWRNLPFDSEGMTGCTLYVQPLTHLAGFTGGGGGANFTLQLPNLPVLIGESLLVQWLVADAGANPRGLTFSDGGRATLGR